MVVSGPELLGGVAGVGDFVFPGVEVDGFAGAVGDVGEVAEHGAFLGDFDFGGQGLVVAEGFDEVAEVVNIAAGAALFFDFVAFGVVDGILVAT